MRRLALVVLVGACASDKPAPRADPAPPAKPIDAAVPNAVSDAAPLDATVADAAAAVTGETSRVVELALSGTSACARRADGHVRCWGSLGPGRPPQTVPLEIPGIDDASAIDADTVSEQFTIVRAGGEVVRWRLGGPSAATSIVTGEADVVAAHAHAGDLYVLTRTADLVHRTATSAPRKLLGDIVALDRLRGGPIVALDRDGTVSLLVGARPPRKIRGLTDATALIGGSCARRKSDALICWDGAGKPRPWKGPTNVVDRRSGAGFSCDLTRSGVACAGRNDVGQLGAGPGPDRADPKLIALPAKPTGIDAGTSFACALLGSGEVACWGLNDAGQLGDGTLLDRAVPQEVAGVTSAAVRTPTEDPTLPVATAAMDWSDLPQVCTRPTSLQWDEPALTAVVSAYAYVAPGSLRVVLADFALEPSGYPRTSPVVRGTQRAVELTFRHAAGKKGKPVDRGLYRAKGPRAVAVVELSGNAVPRAQKADVVIEKIDTAWVCGQLLDPDAPSRRQPFAARFPSR